MQTSEPGLYCYLNDYLDPAYPRVVRILDETNDLYMLATDSLRRDDLASVVGQLGQIQRAAIGLLDTIGRSKSGSTPPDPGYVSGELERIEARLDPAQEITRRNLTRASQFVYLSWMAVALLVATLVSAVIAWLAQATDSRSWGYPLAAALLAGAVGAGLSVIKPLKNAQHVAFDSGRPAFRLFGFLHPIEGGFFGAAVYAVLAGGFLLLRPAADIDPLLYSIGLGFLAGFFDGFALDLLTRAAGVRRGRSKRAPRGERPG